MENLKLVQLEEINAGSKASDIINGIAGGILSSNSMVIGAGLFAAGAAPVAAVAGGVAAACAGGYMLWNAID